MLIFCTQVYKVFKTKNVESLSSGFVILQIITCLFLTAYGMGFIFVNDISVPTIIAYTGGILVAQFTWNCKNQI